MRTWMTAIVLVGLLIVAAVVASGNGSASDADEERLADLETRVAALETEVAASRDGTDGQDGQDGQSGASSSTQQTSTSFSGVYSGNGDREFELDLNHAGTYQLTLTAGDGTSVALVDADGVPVDAFNLASDSSGASTVSSSLDAGAYRLQVQSDTSWSITLVLVA